MSEWQPMDEHPKKGEIVLVNLFSPPDDNYPALGCVVRGAWKINEAPSALVIERFPTQWISLSDLPDVPKEKETRR